MLQVDERVQFVSELSIEPYAQIERGEMGTVEATSGDGDVWVRLDRAHAELADWQNCVYLPAHFAPLEIVARVSSRAA